MPLVVLVVHMHGMQCIINDYVVCLQPRCNYSCINDRGENEMKRLWYGSTTRTTTIGDSETTKTPKTSREVIMIILYNRGVDCARVLSIVRLIMLLRCRRMYIICVHRISCNYNIALSINAVLRCCVVY